MSSDEDKNFSSDPAEQASGDAAPNQNRRPESPPPRGGRVLGSFALLLALIALGASGWLVYQDQLDPSLQQDDRPVQALLELEQALDGMDRKLAEVEQRQQSNGERLNRLDRLEQRIDGRDEQLARLEQGMGRVGERSETLARQLEVAEQQLVEQRAETSDLRRRLEAAVAQLDARGDLQRETDRDLRQQMLMLEVAGLLRTGQDLAEVRGDVRQAQRAFQRAQSRLTAIDDARLDRVRRSLAREIEALADHDGLDVPAELARLERLGRESRTWPLQLRRAKPETDADADEEEGWRQRLGDTFGALVRVERRDSLGRSEEQFEAGREQLRLRLLAAELALMRRDSDALTLQLEAAVALLEEWFEPGASQVTAARETLRQLSELDLSPDLPALGLALEQLQTRLEDS